MSTVVNVTFHLHSQAFEVIFDELNSHADIFGYYKPAVRELGSQHPTHLISQHLPHYLYTVAKEKQESSTSNLNLLRLVLQFTTKHQLTTAWADQS